MNNTGAVLLAAGLSSRMQAFKPMLPLGDSTLIRTALATFYAENVSPVVVVTGRESELLQTHLADLSLKCVFNANYAITDMFASVQLGIAELLGSCGRAFILPADVPLFTVGTLRLMETMMMQSRCDVVIPLYAGRGGHPLLINEATLMRIAVYDGEMGLHGALQQDGICVKRLECNDPAVRLDANTPEDYRRLFIYMAEHRKNL